MKNQILVLAFALLSISNLAFANGSTRHIVEATHAEAAGYCRYGSSAEWAYYDALSHDIDKGLAGWKLRELGNDVTNSACEQALLQYRKEHEKAPRSVEVLYYGTKEVSSGPAVPGGKACDKGGSIGYVVYECTLAITE